MVAVAQGGEEGAGDLGGEGVHGGGVGGDADGGVGAGLDLGGGGAVEEQEVLGCGQREALKAVQVAVAVLEADDVRQGGDAAERVGGEGDLAALVGDQGQRGAGGDLLQLGDQAVLRGGDEVVRQHQECVGSGVLGDAREPDGLRPAVAGARDHGDAAGRLLDGDGDDLPVLVLVEREELSGAAGREDGAGRGGESLGDVGTEAVRVEGAVVAEAGQRERQHAARHALPQPLRDRHRCSAHGHHPVISLCRRHLYMRMRAEYANVNRPGGPITIGSCQTQGASAR